MKRNLLASVLFACAVILAVASCGRSHSSETSNDTIKEGSSPVEVKEERTKKGPSPPAENKDPIISMMMASSIDEKGKLVNPRFSFPQTEKQITAIVQLGNIKGSQLTVTWYKTSDEGDTKLFEHQIQVKSHERAFSVAKNPGRFFSAGTYKVVATLDGQTEKMEFDIIPPKPAPKKTSDNRDETHFADQTEFKKDCAFSAETNADGSLQLISYEPAPDQSQVRQVALPQSGPAQPTSSAAAPGQPPVAGDSGATSNSTNMPPVESPTGNVLVLTGGTDTQPDKEGYAEFDYYVYNSREPLKIVSVYGSGWGSMEIIAKPGEVEQGFLPVSVCSPNPIGAASDLPGTKIPLKAIMRDTSDESKPEEGPEVLSASTVITLGDDTSPPRVHVVSTPARGSKVNPGDKIKLKVDATEIRKGGSWQTGVKMIQVIPGDQVKEKPWINPASPLSQTCEQKTWEQKYEATYTVPNNPPPIIKLCAEAEDYAGNQGSNCGEFIAGNVWKGKLRSVSTQVGKYGQCSNETWAGEFRVVVGGNGEVQGKGSGHLVAPPKCSGNLYFTGCPSQQATQVDFDVYGTFDGKQFQLAFSETRINGSTCGLSNYTIWLDPSHTWRIPGNFIVPIIAPGDAEGQVSNSDTSGDATGNGQHTITMLCSDCR